MLTLKPTHTPYRHTSAQAGMTLIEVLVALLIFSFGLLGFVGLQARAINYSTGAEDSNRAALLANEISAAMILQQTVSLPSATISTWQARVANAASAGLPSASSAIVSSPAASSATITITWRPTTASGANSTHQYTTQVFVP